MSEGVLKNDDAIKNFGRKLLDYAMPEGFENKTDFIPTGCNVMQPVEESIVSGEFLGWPQQEAIIAYRLAYNLFGDVKYQKLADKIENVIFSYFDTFEGTIWNRQMFRKNGEYISSLNFGEGHISGPFHFERYLLAVGTMQENGSILQYVK